MPKITIATDDGEVIAMIEKEEVGDLSKPAARSDLMNEIAKWWDFAVKKEEAESE